MPIPFGFLTWREISHEWIATQSSVSFLRWKLSSLIPLWKEAITCKCETWYNAGKFLDHSYFPHPYRFEIGNRGLL